MERPLLPCETPQYRDHTILGIALIVGAVFLMSLADALVKLASAELTLWQIYLCRSLFAVPLLAVLLRRQGSGLWPRAPGWAYLRSALLVLMWIAYYAALPRLSLSLAATALYTAPLFIAWFSALAIGEPVGLRRWLAILVGFAGVLAILRPGSEVFSWFMLLPVIGAACYAAAMILTRSKCREETPLGLALALNLSLLVAGLVMTGSLAAIDLSPRKVAVDPFVLGGWAAMGMREWGLVALLGLLIAVYSAWVARAYQVAAPAVVGTFDYAYLVFAACWGFVLFGDVPDFATLTGMVLIAGAGMLVVRPTGRPHAGRL